MRGKRYWRGHEDDELDEFARLTVLSEANETNAIFNKRLIDFWTLMLRSWPEEYKRVHAEAAQFELRADRLTRQYFVGSDICKFIQSELSKSRLDYEPIDVDDLYSKYEATPPEWFQIPH